MKILADDFENAADATAENVFSQANNIPSKKLIWL